MKVLIVSMVAAICLAISASPIAVEMPDVAKKNNCIACHTIEKKLIGPAWQVIAYKYKGDAGATEKLSTRIVKGGVGVFGPIPMPANSKMTEADIREVVTFILGLAK